HARRQFDHAPAASLLQRSADPSCRRVEGAADRVGRLWLPGGGARQGAPDDPIVHRGADGPGRAAARRQQGVPPEEPRGRDPNAGAVVPSAGLRAMSLSFARSHLDETARIAAAVHDAAVERLAAILASVRARGGRLFFLGIGGGAAHAAHAVNDFRKLAGFEAYAPTDNVAELTARVNDEGWEGVFATWLEESRLRPADAV